MRSKLLIIAAAVVLGGIAAYLTFQYVGGARAQVEAQAQPVQVFIATEDLTPGESAAKLLDAKKIVLTEVPRRFVAEGAVSTPASIDGKVLSGTVSKGEQITSSRFSYSTDAGLALAVPKGMIAVAIPSNPARSVADLLRPGDFVAVMATLGDDAQTAETRIILPKARVLAIDSSMVADQPQGEGDGKGGMLGGDGSADKTASNQTVTVALSPGDAEKLVFAEEHGAVWLGLLPSTASGGVRARGASYNTVMP